MSKTVFYTALCKGPA